MEYLKIKNGKNQKRADGTHYAVPLFITKNRKYGKVTSEQAISVKKPILVTGAHDSGKTRWLMRLYENSTAIWGSKIKSPALYLDSLSPLSAWIDAPALAEWWDKQDPDTPWQKLKQHDRAEALPTYCQETKAVLFIDDAHKLAGRKLQLARQCVLASKIFVIASSEEQRLSPNLRSVVMRREPQIFRLDSEVAYDATKIIMWMVIATCIAAGFWEGAAVLGGLQALGSGRRAARAD